MCNNDIRATATMKVAQFETGGSTMSTSNFDFQSLVKSWQEATHFKDLNWSGSFDDYLSIVKENPKVTRNAYQRMYDMIMEHGTETYIDVKKEITRYKFFDDADANGKDAVFGLDIPLMKLVNVLRSAALGYGTEKRVIQFFLSWKTFNRCLISFLYSCEVGKYISPLRVNP